MAKQVVIFDFDGVINRYNSGWQGTLNIPDGPVEKIRECIAEIRKFYKVVVVSTRCYSEGGIEAIKNWLKLHDIVVDDVTGEKPPAIVTIDDRAICFDGDPTTLLNKIQSFQPWYKKQTHTKTQTIAVVKCNSGEYLIAENGFFELTTDICEAFQFEECTVENLTYGPRKMAEETVESFFEMLAMPENFMDLTALKKLKEVGYTIIAMERSVQLRTLS